MKIPNCKIKVNPYQNREIQEILFKNGVYWAGDTQGNIRYMDADYLVIENGKLHYGKAESLFDSYASTPIPAEEFIKKYSGVAWKPKTKGGLNYKILDSDNMIGWVDRYGMLGSYFVPVKWEQDGKVNWKVTSKECFPNVTHQWDLEENKAPDNIDLEKRVKQLETEVQGLKRHFGKIDT